MKESTALGILLALGLLLQAPAVRAQPDSDPREVEARRECSAGRYQRGVDILAALYADTNDPISVYNQGRCYEENNQLESAVSRFREYVRKLEQTTGNAGEIAEVRARVKGLEDRVATERAQAHVVAAPPPPERPLYRRGWFWAAVGAVAAGSVTAMLLANRSQGYQSPSCPECTLSVVGVPTR